MSRLTPRRAAVGVSALSALAGVLLARQRASQFDRDIDRHVGELIAATDPQTGTVTDADLDALPDPIRRHLERALEPDQPRIRRVKLHQNGEFRLGPRWHPFEATQWVSTRPPAFLWDATVELAPLLPVRVVDRYQDREGVLDARVRSLVPVAQAGPGHAMNEGELLRCLAEAVWYPTVLASDSIEWDPVDDDAAKATLRDGSVTASATFHVGSDAIERVTGRRYRQDEDSYAEWVGRFEDYERRSGLLVPTAGEVAWKDGDGERPYWRATVSESEYTFARE